MNDGESALHHSRWHAIRSRLDETGLRALLVAGHGTLHQYGYLEYVTGYCAWQRDGYGVLTPSGGPIFIAPTAGDAELARSLVAGLEAVVGGSGEPLPAVVARCLRDLGVTSGPIGLVGPQLISAAHLDAIKSLLPAAEFSDATALLAQLRARKTPGEVAGLRRASEIADAGMQTFAEAVRPGVVARAAYAEVERTVRALGARETIVRLGPGPYFVAPPPARTIESGDLLSAYVEVAGPGGYWVEQVRLFAIGTLDVSSERLLQACIQTLKAAEGALRVGNRAGDVAAAVEEAARRSGYATDGDAGHGAGIDDQDLPRVTIGSTTVLASGMALSLHPRLVDARRGVGAVLGETYLLGDAGPTPLTTGDLVVRVG